MTVIDFYPHKHHAVYIVQRSYGDVSRKELFNCGIETASNYVIIYHVGTNKIMLKTNNYCLVYHYDEPGSDL